MRAPESTYVPLIAIGDQRPSGARERFAPVSCMRWLGASRAPNPNASRLDEPQTAGEWLPLEQRHGLAEERYNSRNRLSLRAEDKQARVVRRRIRANIGKAEIQGDEDAAITPRLLAQRGIGSPAESFVVNRFDLMARVAQELRTCQWHMLIELKAHAGGYAGIASTRSRASSAA
jgi:hypothetical protein